MNNKYLQFIKKGILVNIKKITIVLLLLVVFLLILNIFNTFNEYKIKQVYFDDIYGHFRSLEVVINDAKPSPISKDIDDRLTDSTYRRLYEQTYLLRLSLDFGNLYIDDKLARSLTLREIQATIEEMKNKELTKEDYIFLDHYYDAVLSLLNQMTEGGEYFIIMKDNVRNTRKEKLWKSEFNYIIKRFDNHMQEYLSHGRR